MRPDIGFCAQDRTEGLTLRDHSDLLGRLLAEPHETIKPCRGVPVTPGMDGIPEATCCNQSGAAVRLFISDNREPDDTSEGYFHDRR